MKRQFFLQDLPNRLIINLKFKNTRNTLFLSSFYDTDLNRESGIAANDNKNTQSSRTKELDMKHVVNLTNL